MKLFASDIKDHYRPEVVPPAQAVTLKNTIKRTLMPLKKAACKPLPQKRSPSSDQLDTFKIIADALATDLSFSFTNFMNYRILIGVENFTLDTSGNSCDTEVPVKFRFSDVLRSNGRKRGERKFLEFDHPPQVTSN